MNKFKVGDRVVYVSSYGRYYGNVESILAGSCRVRIDTYPPGDTRRPEVFPINHRDLSLVEGCDSYDID